MQREWHSKRAPAHGIHTTIGSHNSKHQLDLSTWAGGEKAMSAGTTSATARAHLKIESRALRRRVSLHHHQPRFSAPRTLSPVMSSILLPAVAIGFQRIIQPILARSLSNRTQPSSSSYVRHGDRRQPLEQSLPRCMASPAFTWVVGQYWQIRFLRVKRSLKIS